MSQLKNDIVELFSDSDTIKQYFEDYNGVEYDDIIIKEAYEPFPEITYPNIIIQETNNLPTHRYWDGKEFATSLAYQFTINCEQSDHFTANKNVEIIQKIIDNYIQNSKYNCFRRVGYSSPRPLPEDVNVRCGFLRYDCNLVASENTIYRRY